jgi:hypothetical protein
MKSGRFFVTSVIIFGMATVIACNGNTARQEQARRDKATQELNHRRDLVTEGNAKIKASEDIKADLANKYKLVISDDPKDLSNVAKFNWQIAKADRREIDGKLAQYLQLINRILEIDSMKNITIDNRDKITSSRNSAEAYQKSLEAFEKTFGQNFEPKADTRITKQVQND